MINGKAFVHFRNQGESLPELHQLHQQQLDDPSSMQRPSAEFESLVHYGWGLLNIGEYNLEFSAA
jgi:hypothetical protein